MLLLLTYADYQLPHIPSKTKGWEALQLEEITVEVTKSDGTIKIYERVPFPVVFGQVMDFYLEDTNPIFFPRYASSGPSPHAFLTLERSYEYHTLSANGVVLRHCLLQTNRGGASLALFTHDYLLTSDR